MSSPVTHLDTDLQGPLSRRNRENMLLGTGPDLSGYSRQIRSWQAETFEDDLGLR
jgi:hypothetical protein